MEVTQHPLKIMELIDRLKSKRVINNKYEFSASKEEVFKIIGNLEEVTTFFPLIYHAAVENMGSSANEDALRVCSIYGMGKVNEKIVWWNDADGFAYQASGTFVPLKDHLGIITLSKNENTGGTTLIWQQYFKTRFGPLGWIFPSMMKLLMGKAIRNIKNIL